MGIHLLRSHLTCGNKEVIDARHACGPCWTSLDAFAIDRQIQSGCRTEQILMTSGTTAPASQIEVVDEVASVLRERIVTGRYAPGTALGQERVAAELGIGRTPTREALRILEQEGLVHVDGRRGARVVTADRRRLVQAYEARGVMDGLAARLAAQRPDRHGWLPYLDRLLAAEQRLVAEPASRARRQAGADFHAAITHLSGNRFLVSQLSLIDLTIQVLAPDELLDETAARRAVREHRAIRDAIERGDGPQAEALARDHVDGHLSRLRSLADAPTSGTPSQENNDLVLDS
jgi:DNA-binding GntR family transcriptional regulator